MKHAPIYFVFFLYLTVDITSANEICNSQYYCGDYGNQIGYCCGWVTNEIPRCCTYTAWYSLWYLWFGIIAFLMLLSGCVTACCKKSRQTTTRGAASTNRPVNVATVTTTTTTQKSNQNYGFEADFPPKYEVIQQQQQQQQLWSAQNPQEDLPPYPSQPTMYSQTSHQSVA